MKTMMFVSRNVFDGISGRLNTKAEKKLVDLKQQKLSKMKRRDKKKDCGK